jgi:hypothetical protein
MFAFAAGLTVNPGIIIPVDSYSGFVRGMTRRVGTREPRRCSYGLEFLSQSVFTLAIPVCISNPAQLCLARSSCLVVQHDNIRNCHRTISYCLLDLLHKKTKLRPRYYCHLALGFFTREVTCPHFQINSTKYRPLRCAHYDIMHCASAVTQQSVTSDP